MTGERLVLDELEVSSSMEEKVVFLMMLKSCSIAGQVACKSKALTWSVINIGAIQADSLWLPIFCTPS